jgi:hypothetical protein
MRIGVDAAGACTAAAEASGREKAAAAAGTKHSPPNKTGSNSETPEQMRARKLLSFTSNEKVTNLTLAEIDTRQVMGAQTMEQLDVASKLTSMPQSALQVLFDFLDDAEAGNLEKCSAALANSGGDGTTARGGDAGTSDGNISVSLLVKGCRDKDGETALIKAIKVGT